MNFEEVKVEKIPIVIVNQFRKRLMEGSLKQGQRLPAETELAEMFGVGRSSIREAMQILEGLGIIHRRKREGTVIRQITAEDLAGIYVPKPENETLLDLIETREVLELAAVKLAAHRATSEELEELERSIAWMENSPEEAARADVVFHITLTRLSHNQVMTSIVNSLKQIMTRLQFTIGYPGRVEETIIEHRQILNAIKAGNGEAAQEAMRDHLNKVKEMVRDYSQTI